MEVSRCELQIWLLVALAILLVVPISSLMDKHDRTSLRLNYDLFKKNSYNSLIRPVENTSKSLQVNFSLALSAIINVDEKNQVIITNVWLQMYWYDYQLRWNPADYEGIEKLKINNTHVWVPDVVLFNNADGKFEPSYNPNCVLEHNGNVKFIPPAIYTSSCSINVEYFPFDQQVCEMKFGSWTFEGKTLVYNFPASNLLDLTDYMKNGAWDIIECPGVIETIKDSITGEPKEIIVFRLKLRRKTLFYTVNLIIPCFLHAFVCLCVFVLPADGCDKITLVISALVSLVVFLLVLQKILPPSKTIPLIAKYFIFTFIMIVLEIVVTVVIIFLNHKTPRTDHMPKWICWLFLYKLPKYLFMERPNHDDRWQQKSCTPPPSYPTTPQIPRANIFPIRALDLKLKKLKLGQKSSKDRSNTSKDSDRVNALRHKFSTSKSQGAVSSSASGSRVSADDISPNPEGRGFSPIDLPTNGHRCMLRDSATSQSDDSLDGDELLGYAGPPAPVLRRPPNPIVLTKEIYSACNAIKFICHQLSNKEDYHAVLDDWKYVAAVLDRLLMVIFILVSLGGTLGVLINAPHILETVDQDKIIADIMKAQSGT